MSQSPLQTQSVLKQAQDADVEVGSDVEVIGCDVREVRRYA